MPSSSSARWLAPVALVGALVAVIVVASSGGSSSDGGAATTTTTPQGARTTRTTPATTTPTTPTSAPRTYTVQPGDVLSAIAEKTGVPLEEIEQLNPDIDAQSLHAGQKLKLAP